MDLIIVSNHLHKVREIRCILKKLPLLEIYSLRDFPSFQLEAPSLDMPLEEQAAVSAKTAAKALQKWTLADVLVLCVPCLQHPPFYEDGFQGEQRKKLLKDMAAFPNDQRSAYLECHTALSSPEGCIKKSVRVCVEGSIASEERGGNGYGFDPLFVKLDYDKTFAELPETLKARVSVRNKVLEKTLPSLEMLTTVHALLP